MVGRCIDHGADAVCVSAGRRLKTAAIAAGEGSLTGRPNFKDSVQHVGEVAQYVRGRVAIKAAGGVFTGDEALAMLQAGATTVEVFSAFIYRGWNVAGHIKRELVVAMGRAGISGLEQLADHSERRESIAR